MAQLPSFLFTTCQVGAEAALKHEVGRDWPSFRFAYSRPGFVTFKLPAGAVPPDDLDLQSVFARAHGFSLGKVTGESRDEMAEQVWKLVGERPVERLHVWSRDVHEPGYRDYEPGMTAQAEEIGEVIRAKGPVEIQRSERRTPNAERPTSNGGDSNQETSNAGESRLEIATPVGACLFATGATDASTPSSATPPGPPFLRGGDVNRQRGGEVSQESGRLVADVVLVEPAEWWVGFHRVFSIVSGWPGGLFLESLPADAVSRVYLKMLEAVRWSEFDIKSGERIAEIGCAPGGASQGLLDLGANVVGIDPAEIHPLVLGHPRFRHIRRRSKEVRRNEFLGVDWLTCDINLPPNYALDTVEAVVSYPGVRLKGMLLTLKLIDWALAAKVPEYLDRVRAWGFRDVRARQLHHDRREICVAAR